VGGGEGRGAVPVWTSRDGSFSLSDGGETVSVSVSSVRMRSESGGVYEEGGGHGEVWIGDHHVWVVGLGERGEVMGWTGGKVEVRVEGGVDVG